MKKLIDHRLNLIRSFIPEKILNLIGSGDVESTQLAISLSEHKVFLLAWLQINPFYLAAYEFPIPLSEPSSYNEIAALFPEEDKEIDNLYRADIELYTDDDYYEKWLVKYIEKHGRLSENDGQVYS